MQTEQPLLAGELFRPDHEQEDYNRLLEQARASIRADHWLAQAQEAVLRERRVRKEPDTFDPSL